MLLMPESSVRVTALSRGPMRSSIFPSNSSSTSGLEVPKG